MACVANWDDNYPYLLDTALSVAPVCALITSRVKPLTSAYIITSNYEELTGSFTTTGTMSLKTKLF